MRILAISGSLRAASINSALLRATARLAPPDIEVTCYAGVGDLPLVNPDLEAPVPPQVAQLRAEVAAADALLIASPEYAHGVTAVIKNALDWLVSLESFSGKPVAVLNASPRARHSDSALRETLKTMSAVIVEAASISIPLLGASLTEDDMVDSPSVSLAIKGSLGALYRAVVTQQTIADVPRATAAHDKTDSAYGMSDLSNLNEPESLQALWVDTRACGFTMASEPLTCSLLRTLAATKPGGRFLELGSGTGLSTAWLLDGMDPNSRLTTVDNDESFLSVLRKNLGEDQRLTVVCADGDEFLGSLDGQQFDFIFADTWSGKYRLLDEALSLVSPGGLYVIDDMCPQPNWPQGHAEKVAHLISTLEQRSDFRVTKMSWASGIILAAKL